MVGTQIYITHIHILIHIIAGVLSIELLLHIDRGRPPRRTLAASTPRMTRPPGARRTHGDATCSVCHARSLLYTHRLYRVRPPSWDLRSALAIPTGTVPRTPHGPRGSTSPRAPRPSCPTGPGTLHPHGARDAPSPRAPGRYTPTAPGVLHPRGPRAPTSPGTPGALHPHGHRCPIAPRAPGPDLATGTRALYAF